MFQPSETKLEYDRKCWADRRDRFNAWLSCKRPQWRCFWSVPFGHRYERDETRGGFTSIWLKCVSCERTKVKYSAWF